MSKTYRCRVKKDIQEVHRVQDELEYKLGLLDILPPEEMEKDFRKALEDMGAREEEDGSLTLEIEGIQVTVDTEEKKAIARVGEEKEISVEVEREVYVFDWGDNKENAQRTAEQEQGKGLEQELARKLEQEKEKHERRVRGKLEGAREKIQEKLREAVNETHKNALRKKASRMGKILADREEEQANGDQRLTLEIELN